MSSRVLPFIVMLVLVLGFSRPAVVAAQKKKAPQIGQPAPEFTLSDINGKTVRLSDFKGKKNVLAVIHRGWVGYW